MLAEGSFLALDVDLDHDGNINSTADVQIEFGQEICVLFRCSATRKFPYPDTDQLSFNRTALEPLWGAWKAEILFIAAVQTLSACC